MTPHSFHEDEVVEAFFRNRRLDPFPLRRMRYLMYHENRAWPDAVRELPERVRDEFLAMFGWDHLAVVARHDSSLDRSTKLVLAARDGLQFETVILRGGAGRTSLCVSSQIGCAARCVFCATARMGRQRNLSVAEIVAQVAQANTLLRTESRRVRNVVFMGMGEPFHNESAVHAAIGRLLDVRRFALSPRRILVSTVGVIDAMIRFAERFSLVGLAVSLHSTDQAQREQWIPLASRYPLPDLRRALRRVLDLQRRPLMIEYLMVDRWNDGDDDARRLADYLKGLNVHVNLIPYNPIERGPDGFRPSPRARRNAFASVLREAGFLTTIRYSLGADISAACGQLARRTASLSESSTS